MKYMDDDVRCPEWAQNGYCSTNTDINLHCPHSCRKYQHVPAAAEAYPYKFIALHPYQYNVIKTTPPPKTVRNG